MMTEDEVVARLRAAVAGETARSAAALDDLLQRVLRASRAARRRRSVITAAAAVVVLVAAAVGVDAVGRDDDTLVGPDRADSSSSGRPPTVAEAGAVTREMAAREGLDGTPQCRSEAVTAPAPQGAGIATDLSLYAAYLTDAQGYERWSGEYSGFSSFSLEAPAQSGLIALCWYTGSVPEDTSVGGVRPDFTHQLVAVQLTGPQTTAGLRSDMRSPRPLPVLAPPVPADLDEQDPVSRQGRRSFPQPSGVPVLDELPRRVEPSSPAPPVDCTPTACVEPAEETVVRVDIAVDGRALDPRGTRQLTAGGTAQVTLTLDVEPGQTIRDVHLGVSASGPGGGPDGPLGLDQVLLREPAVDGTRTFELTWTVPADMKDSQVVVYYRFDKNQPGSGHARTVGGVSLSANEDGGGAAGLR